MASRISRTAASIRRRSTLWSERREELRDELPVEGSAVAETSSSSK
jgi:hypothetical protein